MKNEYILTLSTLCFTPLLAAQSVPETQLEGFNWETDLSYTTRDTDIEDTEVNEDNIDFGITYYLSEILPSTVALREQAFTARSSSIDFQAGVQELDDDIDNVVDLDTYRINGLWVGADSGWYGKLGYVNASADITGDFTSDIFDINPEFDGYIVEVGKYVAANTTLGVAYSAIDYENQTPDSALESGSDIIGLTFKHYTQINDISGFSIAADLFFVDTQISEFDALDDGNGVESSGEVYSFTATYYPVQQVGVGVSYTDADDLMGRPYLNSRSTVDDGAGLFVEWFATDRLSLKAMYTNGEYDLSDADNINDPGDVETDSLTFGAAYRF